MTHISSRYQNEEAELLLQEAKGIHLQSFLAQDFWHYEIERRES
jgi:ribonuclease Z